VISIRTPYSGGLGFDPRSGYQHSCLTIP